MYKNRKHRLGSSIRPSTSGAQQNESVGIQNAPSSTPAITRSNVLSNRNSKDESRRPAKAQVSFVFGKLDYNNCVTQGLLNDRNELRSEKGHLLLKILRFLPVRRCLQVDTFLNAALCVRKAIKQHALSNGSRRLILRRSCRSAVCCWTNQQM